MALPQRYIEKDFYTEAEYLGWEDDALYKSEYVRGEIRAMSGGTVTHNILSVSIGAELRAALRGRGCSVMSSDMKVKTADGVIRYPDITVICGPPQYYGRSRAVITNPLLVVEVQFPGTEKADRGEKLLEYQGIPSLTDYLLVSQRAPLVEHYVRAGAGHWDYQAVSGLESVLSIAFLSITLPLADIYDQVEFDSD